MSAPAPPVALANQVTAVHTGTLFAYQPNAFQSIDLTSGSKWNALPMGVSVNGSAAVIAQSAGQDALFIVGGRSNDSTQSFPGFQKYVFSSSTWQWLSPETSVAQNRVQHGAAYLQDSKSILIFGGSQDNSYVATSQTYTIGTEEPFAMKSFPAAAPAVQNPILMPFNTSHALLAGGGSSQEQIWLFSEAGGWSMMTTTIPGGIADASKVQGVVTTDGDNKQLELFDMSQSPYKVSTVSLSNQFHKREAVAVSERDVTQTPRSGFSLAQDASNGNIVISGGTSDTSAGSLAIYNAANKAFQDPSAIFGSSASTGSSAGTGSNAGTGSSASTPAVNGFIAPAAGQGAAPDSQSSAGAASASAAAPASSGAPASGAASASQPASSGVSVAASAAASGASSAASGAASGTASGAPSAAAPTGASASGSAASAAGAHTATQTSNGAVSTAAGASAASSSAAAGGPGSDSTTVILGAVLGSFFGIAAIFLLALLLVRYRRNKARQEQLRQAALDEKRAGSPDSVNSFPPIQGQERNVSPFQNGQTPMISRPTLEPQTQAEDVASPRKLGNDDEWGRYFNNNNTVENLYPGAQPGAGFHESQIGPHNDHLGGAALGGAALGLAAGAGFAAAAHNRGTQYTVGSEYTIDSPTSSHPRESALVPPLDLRQSSYGQLGHARSSSNVSSNNRNTWTDSGSSEQQGWDPTNHEEPAHVRPASSIYYDRASSIYPPNPLSPNTMSHFPPVPQHPMLMGQQDKGMRSIISTDFGAGSPPNNGMFTESAARRVPGGTEPRSAGSGNGHDGEERDLGWLKLGSAN